MSEGRGWARTGRWDNHALRSTLGTSRAFCPVDSRHQSAAVEVASAGYELTLQRVEQGGLGVP